MDRKATDEYGLDLELIRAEIRNIMQAATEARQLSNDLLAKLSAAQERYNLLCKRANWLASYLKSVCPDEQIPC